MFVVPLGIAFLAVSVGWVCGSWFTSPLRDFPGPFLASFSRIWHILHIVRGKQNVVLDELHDKYGPIVRIAPDELSVSHPDAIKKILLAPLHKGYWYKALAIPDYRFQTPMSTTDPKKKSELSRPFSAGYTLSNLLQNEEVIDDTVMQFLSYLDRFAKDRRAFDLDKYITFTAFDVVGEMLFSKPFGFLRDNKDIGNAITNGKVLSVYASVIGFVRWIHVAFLGNPFMTWLGILPMGHLYDTTVKALNERLVNRDSRFDIVAHWIRAVDKYPDRVTQRDLYAVTTGAVGAGSDTVSCALQSFIYHMIRQPHLWQRAQKEMDKAVRGGTCSDRVVSFQDAQNLPFLQACIKEALRVFTPVAQGLPRVAPLGGISIGDEHVPEGVIVSVNAWVIHRDRNIWGPDARQFKPDRWLLGDAAALDRYFMPWGQGYNSCPGQHVAKIEVSKIAATLVRDYNFNQVDPSQEWQWKACFTMVPHSWPCHVRKREQGKR